MDADGSVTQILRRVKSGDRADLQEIWERYFERLMRLAWQKLYAAPRRAADEEDVVLSAFDSFFRRAEQGQFKRLEDRDDLWQLLALLAVRKAANLAKHEGRLKAGGGKVQNLSALEEGELPAFVDLISREPDPSLAAEVAEQCEHLLCRLDEEEDSRLRRVAVWKLEGYTNAEIASKLGRKPSTVERLLQWIRATWEEEFGPCTKPPTVRAT
jgi:DNA-directed RNA polymerase specialized sigma24 family protein